MRSPPRAAAAAGRKPATPELYRTPTSATCGESKVPPGGGKRSPGGSAGQGLRHRGGAARRAAAVVAMTARLLRRIAEVFAQEGDAARSRLRVLHHRSQPLP